MKSAVVFNIQKYSVHDGPGIRTTVFFKGCPLKCAWCHNPESHSIEHQLMLNSDKCVGCGKCENRCPHDAIKIVDGVSKLDKSKCQICKKCSLICPKQGIEYVGQTMEVKEMVKEILKDQMFYDESGGGVTFSGGEPMMQPDVVGEVAKRCQDFGVHTAMETSGFATWESFEKVLPHIDLFLIDIKAIQDDIHKEYVGASNQIILENIRKLSALGKKMWIRMPIICGINDGEENITATISFLKEIHFEHVNLLPYHSIGKGKYTKLGKEYTLPEIKEPSDTHMKELAQQFTNNGMRVKVGG